MFGAIAFWSGALGFLRERGVRHPELEVAFVKSRSSADVFKGFFLGRTSDHVYLASSKKKCKDDGCRSVLTIGDDEASCLVFAPRAKVPREDDDQPPKGPDLTEFASGGGDVCEPTDDATTKQDPPAHQSSEHNLSFDFDLDISPRRSVVIRRLRRNFSLDFDFDASPRLSLFSGPPQKKTRFVLVSEVFFPFGKHSLTPGARQQIRNVVPSIRRARPKLVHVYGHADEKGNGDDNRELSDRRARRVRDALVRRDALKEFRVVPHGFGDTWPAVCNRRRGGLDAPGSRVYNRRVAIYTGRPPAASSLRCDG